MTNKKLTDAIFGNDATRNVAVSQGFGGAVKTAEKSKPEKTSKGKKKKNDQGIITTEKTKDEPLLLKHKDAIADGATKIIGFLDGQGNNAAKRLEEPSREPLGLPQPPQAALPPSSVTVEDVNDDDLLRFPIARSTSSEPRSREAPRENTPQATTGATQTAPQPTRLTQSARLRPRSESARAKVDKLGKAALTLSESMGALLRTDTAGNLNTAPPDLAVGPAGNSHIPTPAQQQIIPTPPPLPQLPVAPPVKSHMVAKAPKLEIDLSHGEHDVKLNLIDDVVIGGAYGGAALGGLQAKTVNVEHTGVIDLANEKTTTIINAQNATVRGSNVEGIDLSITADKVGGSNKYGTVNFGVTAEEGGTIINPNGNAYIKAVTQNGRKELNIITDRAKIGVNREQINAAYGIELTKNINIDAKNITIDAEDGHERKRVAVDADKMRVQYEGYDLATDKIVGDIKREVREDGKVEVSNPILTLPTWQADNVIGSYGSVTTPQAVAIYKQTLGEGRKTLMAGTTGETTGRLAIPGSVGAITNIRADPFSVIAQETQEDNFFNAQLMANTASLRLDSWGINVGISKLSGKGTIDLSGSRRISDAMLHANLRLSGATGTHTLRGVSAHVQEGKNQTGWGYDTLNLTSKNWLANQALNFAGIQQNPLGDIKQNPMSIDVTTNITPWQVASIGARLGIRKLQKKKAAIKWW